MGTTTNKTRAYCNDCKNDTLHRTLKTVHSRYDDDETGFSTKTTYDLLQCCGCEAAILRRTYWFSEDPDIDIRYFPPKTSREVPRWRYRLPPEMRQLMEEIYRSLDAENLRLPVMGARTLVDMLLLEKVGDAGTFKQKLAELEKAGFVSSRNRDVLFAVLDLGSAAVHRGHEPSEPDVQAVMDIVENMLHAVYVLPRVADRLRRSTPPREGRKSTS